MKSAFAQKYMHRSKTEQFIPKYTHENPSKQANLQVENPFKTNAFALIDDKINNLQRKLTNSIERNSLNLQHGAQ